MDTDYQDWGMLEAYGLVYELLRNHVTIHWVIRQGKAYGEIDFTTSAVDHQTNDPVVDHGYRGGPFVIAAEDADAAIAVIDAWQDQNPLTAVHEVTQDFDADVAHTLVVAPTIAMFADGNQKIARKYMMAAKIPDSIDDPLWPDESPDMLDPVEVMGPTDTKHDDGALFDEDGDPVYCQFMSMHWGIGDAEDNPEVVAEVRFFLNHPTHFFAECQAVNAYENLDPWGFFLTPNGFLIGDKIQTYDFYNEDTAFGQLDGEFLSVGGSEPAYTLPPNDTYKESDIVMITEQGTPVGVNDVWMTGLLDGICPRNQKGCLSAGKVSYLGGHEYKTDLPISQNPDTQGTRLFLNSLFEAPCATVEGLPLVVVEKDGPAMTADSEVTYTISYVNSGPTTALDVFLTDTLPMDATFISATDGGMLVGDTVIWSLGNLGVGEGGDVGLTINLPMMGTFENTATLEYKVGVNDFDLDSNTVVTVYGQEVMTTGTDTGLTDSGGTDSGGTETGGTDPTGSDSGVTDSASDSGPTDSASDSGATATASDSGTSGSDSGSGTGASDSGSASASGTTAGSDGSDSRGSDSSGDSDSGSDSVGEDDPGCGCRSGGGDGGLAWMLALGLGVLLRRRRRQAA